MVELVEVDVVGAEAPQRTLDRVEDVLAREPLVPGALAHGAEALGRHDEVVAPSREPAADDLLGAADRRKISADRIDVRRVEEGDAARGGAIQNRDRRRLVAL
jgi:hypothetical protein